MDMCGQTNKGILDVSRRMSGGDNHRQITAKIQLLQDTQGMYAVLIWDPVYLVPVSKCKAPCSIWGLVKVLRVVMYCNGSHADQFSPQEFKVILSHGKGFN